MVALLLYYWCVVDDVEDSVCSGYSHHFTEEHSQARHTPTAPPVIQQQLAAPFLICLVVQT